MLGTKEAGRTMNRPTEQSGDFYWGKNSFVYYLRSKSGYTKPAQKKDQAGEIWRGLLKYWQEKGRQTILEGVNGMSTESGTVFLDNTENDSVVG